MRAFALPALVAACMASAIACCFPARNAQPEKIAEAPPAQAVVPAPAPAPAPIPVEAPAPPLPAEAPPKTETITTPAPSPSSKADDEAEAKAQRKAMRRAKVDAEFAAKNKANQEAHAAEVARLMDEHAKKTEKFAAAKKAYDGALPAYKQAKAEFDAATDLAEARTPYGASQGLKEVYRKKQRAIVKAYPGTQAARDAEALLKGGSAPKRKIPPEPVRPGLPKAVPALELPPEPEAIPVVYPPDPEEVAEARAKAEQAERARKAAKDAARGPTRANYNQVRNLMLLADVEEILGPGKETSRSGRYLHMVWRRDRVVITMTFEIFADGPAVRSKSIID